MKQYTVQIRGLDHTVQLDDEDAKRLGDSAKPVSKAQTETKQVKPANKAATPADK